MTTGMLATKPATVTPSGAGYASIEDLFARAELAEMVGELGRALDVALFTARLRSSLAEALDLALIDYDLEQLAMAEAVAGLLAA